MIEPNAKESWTFWQTDEESGVGEPAILLEKYNDVLCLTCQGNSINLNYDSIEELCKLLRRIKKQHDLEDGKH